MKIVYVVNEASFFFSHRLRLAQEAKRRGADVTLVCGANTGEYEATRHDLKVITLPLSRSGVNPLTEFRTFVHLLRLYRRLQPDLVHHVTIKPVVYGSLAARLTRIAGVVNAVPGMGFVFTARGFMAVLRRFFISNLYRLALGHPNMRVIFQNREDLNLFVQSSIVRPEQSVMIRGSGVDLTEYDPLPEPPTESIVFVLIARMLRDKGIGEFVDAARKVKLNYPNWDFWLVGDIDPGNPGSLKIEDLLAWDRAGIVHWLGHREDVPEILQLSHVLVLPSYYREGLPKTLLEAGAAVRPIIASRVAGCLEFVTDGVTGLIVAPRDVEDLVAAMVRLGNDAPLRRRLAEAARSKVEAIFRVEDVVRDTFVVYQQLLHPVTAAPPAQPG